MRSILALTAIVSLCLASPVATAEDDDLANDLKQLQGKWEMLHVDDGAGGFKLRSVKEIEGNQETLRRYDVNTGKLLREHTVEFKLTKSGDVRVFTFYPVGGNPKQGGSFLYKVNAESFYDVPGLLHGDTYRNYQDSPTVWHWKKVKATSEVESPKPPKP